VRNLFAVAERSGKTGTLRAALNRVVVASIGPVASAVLRQYEVKIDVEAKPPKLGPLMSALESALT
jgi:uroporphyrinogen-III synthase